MVCYIVGSGREMEMCAAVSVTVFYRGETEGNGDMYRSYRYGLLHCGEWEGNGNVCCS